MKNFFPWAIVAIAVGIGIWYYSGDTPVKPDVTPPKAGAKILNAFRNRAKRDADHARLDASRLGKLARSLHAYLDADWRSPAPFITTGVEADNLRIIARNVLTAGESLAEQYPELRPALEEHFTAYVGSSGGPLDAERKQKWLDAWSSLAEGCEYAAGEL